VLLTEIRDLLKARTETAGPTQGVPPAV
jgi:hypothetical protein